MSATNPNKITCPQCRVLMRRWALDSQSPDIAGDQQ